MKQLLSYKLPVYIDAYSGVAGNVAALMCMENGEDVILKNHFLITYSQMLHAPGFNWLYYDDGFKIQDDIQEWIDEGEFIYKVKQCIGQGYYVHLYLNHFFISCSDTYHKADKFHDCATIFGYDDQCFLVGDNYYNGKYKVETIKYNEFVEARQGAKGYPAYKFRIRKQLPTLDKNVLKQLVENYYSSNATLKEEEINQSNIRLLNDEIVCGMDYYNVLTRQVQNCKTDKYEIRTFAVFCNHMDMYLLIEKYLQRMQLCYEEEWFHKEIKKLIEISHKMKFLYIKLSIQYSEDKKRRLLEYISDCKNRECAVLEELLKTIL